MSKKIVLARPHPFIVSQMQPFLADLGYSGEKLERLEDLDGSLDSNTRGAVISLAVTSSLGESAEAVFLKLRQLRAQLPVLFVALLDFAQAQRALQQLAGTAGVAQPVLIDVSEANVRNAMLGKSGAFFYIGRKDLENPARRALAAKMLESHFS